MNRHNHVTRDIKPLGQCPGCDPYWQQAAEVLQAPVEPQSPDNAGGEVHYVRDSDSCSAVDGEPGS